MPKISVYNENRAGNGSAIIKGVIENVKCSPNSVEFTNGGIKIKGSIYDIIGKENINGDSSGKLCSSKLLVKVEGDSDGK